MSVEPASLTALRPLASDEGKGLFDEAIADILKKDKGAMEKGECSLRALGEERRRALAVMAKPIEQGQRAAEAQQHGQHRNVTQKGQRHAHEDQHDVQDGEQDQLAEAVKGFLMLAQLLRGNPRARLTVVAMANLRAA